MKLLRKRKPCLAYGLSRPLENSTSLFAMSVFTRCSITVCCAVFLDTLRVNAAADVLCVRNCYNGIRSALYFLMMGDHLSGDQVKALITLADEIAGVD